MNTEEIKRIETEIVDRMMKLSLIDPKFVGQVTLHLNQGGITDYDKIEKSLKRKMSRI